MTALGWIFVVACLSLFIWVFFTPKKTDKRNLGNQQASAKEAEQSFKAGMVTGMMGGNIEDAALTRYAVFRVKNSNDTDIVIAGALSTNNGGGE